MANLTDALIFIKHYEYLVANIEKVVKPEFYPAIAEMYETDPHDLISPETVFIGHGIEGTVWALFYKIAKKRNLL